MVEKRCPGEIIIGEAFDGGEAFSCSRPIGHKGRHRTSHYDEYHRQRYALEWTSARPLPRARRRRRADDPLSIPPRKPQDVPGVGRDSQPVVRW